MNHVFIRRILHINVGQTITNVDRNNITFCGDNALLATLSTTLVLDSDTKVLHLTLGMDSLSLSIVCILQHDHDDWSVTNRVTTIASGSIRECQYFQL